MNIEKLKSGSYRITQMIEGKRYRATVDHKPTSAEAVKIMSNLIDRSPAPLPNKTFKDAFNEYIKVKSEVLSPSTIRGYYYLVKRIDEDILNKKLNQITAVDLQRIINEDSSTHAYKSVKNLRGHIMSVLNMYDLKIKPPSLPQKDVKEIYIPTETDVSMVLEALKDSKFECATLLSVMGLRRSEICALGVEDLDDNNVLTINKAMVQTKDGTFIIRNKTKTDTSTRKLVLPPQIANLIRKQGFIYHGHPNSILDGLKAAEKRLGLPYFPPHRMRHFFASYLLKMGYTTKQIMAVGGWKTDNVLKTVYQHAMDLDQSKINIAEDIGKVIDLPTNYPRK